MRPYLRVSSALLFALATALSLVACTATAPVAKSGGAQLTVPSPPALPASIPALDSTAGLSLPIDAYRPDSRQLDTLSAARQMLVRACMRRFGVDYPVLPSATTPATDPMSSRYGILDAAAASQWGYGQPPTAPGARVGPTGTVNPATGLLLTGWPDGARHPGQTPPSGQSVQGLAVPAGGCTGEASRTLAGPDDEQGALVEMVDANGYHQAANDPRVVAAQHAWSACMAKRGYTFSDSLSAGDTFKDGAPTQAEIRTALADIACKKESNIVGVWYAAEVAYENVLIQQNIQQLTEIKQRLLAEVNTAAKVVAKGGS